MFSRKFVKTLFKSHFHYYLGDTLPFCQVCHCRELLARNDLLIVMKELQINEYWSKHVSLREVHTKVWCHPVPIIFFFQIQISGLDKTYYLLLFHLHFLCWNTIIWSFGLKLYAPKYMSLFVFILALHLRPLKNCGKRLYHAILN